MTDLIRSNADNTHSPTSPTALEVPKAQPLPETDKPGVCQAIQQRISKILLHLSRKGVTTTKTTASTRNNNNRLFVIFLLDEPELSCNIDVNKGRRQLQETTTCRALSITVFTRLTWHPSNSQLPTIFPPSILAGTNFHQPTELDVRRERKLQTIEAGSGANEAEEAGAVQTRK